MRYIILVFIVFIIACSHKENYFYELPNIKGGIKFPSSPEFEDIYTQNEGKLIYWIGSDIKYFSEFEYNKNYGYLDNYLQDNGPLIYLDSKKKKGMLNFNKIVYGIDTFNLTDYSGMYLKDNFDSHSFAYIHVTNNYRFSFEIDFSSKLKLSNDEKMKLFNDFFVVEPIKDLYDPLSQRFIRNLQKYDIDY
ncbi:MAG: hypothetical protein ACOCWM_06350 [Cyclobacteriaceae bacterium]